MTTLKIERLLGKKYNFFLQVNTVNFLREKNAKMQKMSVATFYTLTGTPLETNFILVWPEHTNNFSLPLQGAPPPAGFWTGDKVLCWARALVPWADFPMVSLTLAGSHNTSIRLTISPQQYLRAVREAEEAQEGQDCFKFAIAESDTG